MDKAFFFFFFFVPDIHRIPQSDLKDYLKEDFVFCTEPKATRHSIQRGWSKEKNMERRGKNHSFNNFQYLNNLSAANVAVWLGEQHRRDR